MVVLCQLSTHKILETFTERKVSSTCIKFIRGGDQITVVDFQESYPHYRKVMLLDFPTLTLLITIPILPTCTVRDITLLFNDRENRLALLMWRKHTRAIKCDSKPPDTDSYMVTQQINNLAGLQVAIFKVSPELFTLSKLCCLTIRSIITKEKVDVLPLPASIKRQITKYTRW